MPRPHMDTRRSVVTSEMFPQCGSEERYRKVTQKKDVCAIAQYSAWRSILADLFHESVTLQGHTVTQWPQETQLDSPIVEPPSHSTRGLGSCQARAPLFFQLRDGCDRAYTPAGSSATNRRKTLPNQTPVRLALALALKLGSATAHPPAAFGAYPVQNAGNHICRPFDIAQPSERHTHLADSSDCFTIAHRILEKCISGSKPKRAAKMKPSSKARHQNGKWQFARSVSRLRSPASI
jgi:hypothetical protein